MNRRRLPTLLAQLLLVLSSGCGTTRATAVFTGAENYQVEYEDLSVSDYSEGRRLVHLHYRKTGIAIWPFHGYYSEQTLRIFYPADARPGEQSPVLDATLEWFMHPGVVRYSLVEGTIRLEDADPQRFTGTFQLVLEEERQASRRLSVRGEFGH